METGEGRGGCGDSRVINVPDRLDVRDTNNTTLAAKPFLKGTIRSFLAKAMQYLNGDGKCRRLSWEPLLRL